MGWWSASPLSVCSRSLPVNLDEEAANVAACCAASPHPSFYLFLTLHSLHLTRHCPERVSRRQKEPVDGDDTRGKMSSALAF